MTTNTRVFGASLPPDILGAASGCMQPSLIASPNPFIFSSQESDMFYVPLAAASTEPMPPTLLAATMTHKPKQVKEQDSFAESNAATESSKEEANVSNPYEDSSLCVKEEDSSESQTCAVPPGQKSPSKWTAFQSQLSALQPKCILPASLPVNSSVQVINGSHLKQIASQPQIITSQAPGNMMNQAQIFTNTRAFGESLPPGIPGAASGCTQPFLIASPNPFIFSSQESDMFYVPLAAASTEPMPPTLLAATMTHKPKQVKEHRPLQ